jgi:GNAT superfamily N-acetyltransferase
MILIILFLVLVIISYFVYKHYIINKKKKNENILEKKKDLSNSNKEEEKEIINMIIKTPLPLIEKYKINEDFFHKSTSGINCGHTADAGLICPLTYVDKDNSLEILTFTECDENIKKEVAFHIFNEWGQENKIDKLEKTIDFIENKWKITDILYVLIKDKKEFIGCIGVDRDKFYPFITHVYVVDKHRGNNYAKLLILCVEKFIKMFKFNQSHLWCYQELTPFYMKLGYEIESSVKKGEKPQDVMVKNLNI